MVGLVYFVFLPSIITTPLAGRAVERFGTRPTLGSIVLGQLFDRLGWGACVVGIGTALLLAALLALKLKMASSPLRQVLGVGA